METGETEKKVTRFCIPPPYWFSLGQTMKIKIRFECKNWLYIQLKVKALLSFYSLKQPQLHTSKNQRNAVMFWWNAVWYSSYLLVDDSTLEIL